ncbi:MAG TPA: hypothetical protein VJK90_09295 [Acetobacteraceae bacterium]|jgi:hypothetical protein|nr:hypothetical protein [Acetobacteraceae bacterium]
MGTVRAITAEPGIATRRVHEAELQENFGFNGPEIRRVTVDLLAHVPALCAQWGTIRGNL